MTVNDISLYLKWRTDVGVPAQEAVFSELNDIEKLVSKEFVPIVEDKPVLFVLRYEEKDINPRRLLDESALFGIRLLSRYMPVNAYLALVPVNWHMKNTPLLPPFIQKLSETLHMSITEEVPILPNGNKIALFRKTKDNSWKK